MEAGPVIARIGTAALAALIAVAPAYAEQQDAPVRIVLKLVKRAPGPGVRFDPESCRACTPVTEANWNADNPRETVVALAVPRMRSLELGFAGAAANIRRVVLEGGDVPFRRERDRLIVELHDARQRRRIEIGCRHENAGYVRRRNLLGAPTQGIGKFAVAGQKQQAAVSGLHRIDDEPSRAANDRQSVHYRLVGGLRSFTTGLNRLPLRFVVGKHSRLAGDPQARCYILPVDDDAVAVAISISGSSGLAVEQHSTGEHPLLDLAARTEAVLSQQFVQALRFGAHHSEGGSRTAC